MELVRHNDFIYEYQDIVSYEECDFIVNVIESHKENILSEFDTIKSDVRHNTSFNITQLSREYDKFSSMEVADIAAFSLVQKCIKEYIADNILIQKYSIMCRSDENFTTEIIYRYYDEKDYYDWHIDSTKFGQFLLSVLIYLNDDFEGGETLFLTDKVKVSPKKGSILVFPCDFRTIHKSTKIRSGTKKILWTCIQRDL